MEDENTPSNNNSDNQNSVEMERSKWVSRRKMSWIALWSMIIITFLLLFAPIPESRLSILVEVITWFFFAMASIIGAYMGFTTWSSRK